MRWCGRSNAGKGQATAVTGTDKRPLRRRLLVNGAVVLASTVVSLMVVEVGFRLYATHLLKTRAATPPLPVVALVAKAHQPSNYPEPVFEYGGNLSFPDHPNFTDSAGLRGPERTVEKPPNTVRIAGLGDSMMSGDLYPAEQTFLFALERLLNEATTPGARFEAINFAVAGYNTEDEAGILRHKALAYAPDWVLLGVVGNDRERAAYCRVRDANGPARLVSRYSIENAVPFSTGFGPEGRPWWACSALARWVHHCVYSRRDHYAGIERFRAAFAEIATACRRQGIRFLPVILTEDVEVSQKENPRALWHQLVCETAESEGVPVLDMYPVMIEHLKQEGLASWNRYWTALRDNHPTPEGHRVIARLLFEKLRALGILDPRPR